MSPRPPSAGSTGTSKPKQPFLKRGEGTEKRLNAWKLRGQLTTKPLTVNARDGAGRGQSPSRPWNPHDSPSLRRSHSPAKWAGQRRTTSPPISTSGSRGLIEQSKPPSPCPQTAPSQSNSGAALDKRDAEAAPRSYRRGAKHTAQAWPLPNLHKAEKSPNGTENQISDQSPELVGNSTLVGFQGGQIVQHQQNSPHCPSPAPMETRWADKLNRLVETVEKLGFEETEQFNVEQINDAEEARRYAKQPPPWNRRPAGPGQPGSVAITAYALDREEEEELELEEFEALERRVRKELGELGTDPMDVGGIKLASTTISAGKGPGQKAEGEILDTDSTCGLVQVVRIKEGWDQTLQESQHDKGWQDMGQAVEEEHGSGILPKDRWDTKRKAGVNDIAGDTRDHWNAASEMYSSTAQQGVKGHGVRNGAQDGSKPGGTAVIPQQVQHRHNLTSSPDRLKLSTGSASMSGAWPEAQKFDDEEAWEDEGEVAVLKPVRQNVSQRQQDEDGHTQNSLATGAQGEMAPGTEDSGVELQTSALMESLFHKQRAEERKRREKALADAEREEAEKIAALEEEIKKFQMDRGDLARMKADLQAAVSKLESDRAVFERQKAAELQAIEEQKEEVARTMKREKNVLEKQRKALLKMPTKKERAEIEALEAVLDKEKKDGRAREARHKLTVERLRRQMVELQQRNAELREEVQWHERQRLNMANSPSGQALEARHPAKPCSGQGRGPKVGVQDLGLVRKENENPNRAATQGTSASGQLSKDKALNTAENDGKKEYLDNSIQDSTDNGQPKGWSYEAGEGTYFERPNGDGSKFGLRCDREAASDSPAQERYTNWSRSQEASSLSIIEDPSGDGGERDSHPAYNANGLTLAQGSEKQQIAPCFEDPPKGRGPGGQRPLHKPGRASGYWEQPRGFVEPAAADQPQVDLRAFEPIQFHAAAGHQATGDLSAQASAGHYHNGAGDDVHQYHWAEPEPGCNSSLLPHQGGLRQPQDQTRQGIESLPTSYYTATDTRAVPAFYTSLGVGELPHLSHGPTPGQQPRLSLNVIPGSSANAQLQPENVGGRPVAGPEFHSGELVVHKVKHADGKLEQMFANGKRTVLFANGTYKEHLPNGISIISFTNRDIKRSFPGGKVEYYYAEVDTWHTTHPSGTEVFHFPTGQMEAHQPNGLKQIRFPDGLVKQVLPNGFEEEIGSSQLLPALQEPVPHMPV